MGNSWIIVLGLLAALGVGVAYWTSTIKWYVALPLVVVIMLLSMAAQAANANADVHKKFWASTCGVGGRTWCYHWKITELRTGLLGRDLWRVHQQIDWGATSLGGRMFDKPSRQRGHWENPLWDWGGWVEVTKHHYLNPERWAFYVKAHELGTPNFDGMGEDNYPVIRMTVYKNGRMTYRASCGC